MSENVLASHTTKVANVLLRVPGHIDDVAKLLVRLAKLKGDDATVECWYGNVLLHVHASCTVAKVVEYFHEQCRAQNPRLRNAA